ncbi:MAG: TetR/AcrR family transcriptional regulator [Microthrixaceae bacterium]
MNTVPAGTAEARPNQREHILDTALQLMSERGATGMSMRQLAAACDLQVAAIYHYFESKDALLAAVVAERRYGARMVDPLPVDPVAAPAERLADLYRVVFAGAMEEQSIWRLLIGEGMRGEPTVLPVGRELLDLMIPAARGWLETTVPELADPAGAAELLVGQMVVGFVRSVFQPELDTAEIAEAGVRTLTAALFP